MSINTFLPWIRDPGAETRSGLREIQKPDRELGKNTESDRIRNQQLLCTDGLTRRTQ